MAIAFSKLQPLARYRRGEAGELTMGLSSLSFVLEPVGPSESDAADKFELASCETIPSAQPRLVYRGR